MSLDICFHLSYINLWSIIAKSFSQELFDVIKHIKLFA